MAKRAVEHLRRMRGGAQSHLMRCEDGNYYVVKFQNNPQGPRILANEMLAGALALVLGLPVTEPEVIEVSDWLVEHSPEMYIQVGRDRVRCASGLQFGSRFPCDPLRTPVYDFLPDVLLGSVRNRDRFPGMLVFDKWTCNCDSRQLVFYRHLDPIHGQDQGHRLPARGNGHRQPEPATGFTATMIDQGFCFHAADWDFPDAPLRGLYNRLAVYEGVSGLESFEPFLTRLQHLDDEIMGAAAARVPPQWYDTRTDQMAELLDALRERRQQIVPLLLACHRSEQNPFPNWKDGKRT